MTFQLNAAGTWSDWKITELLISYYQEHTQPSLCLTPTTFYNSIKTYLLYNRRLITFSFSLPNFWHTCLSYSWHLFQLFCIFGTKINHVRACISSKCEIALIYLFVFVDVSSKTLFILIFPIVNRYLVLLNFRFILVILIFIIYIAWIRWKYSQINFDCFSILFVGLRTIQLDYLENRLLATLSEGLLFYKIIYWGWFLVGDFETRHWF